MKKLLLLLHFIFSALFSISQNLVSNSSFELYSNCPTDENQVPFSINWSSYYGTPEYYNVCATNSDFSIPQNLCGYQVSSTGNAYCGFFAYWSPTFSSPYKNIREHIGRQLSSTLEVGTKYYVSIKVSMAYYAFNCASNNIGVKFSTIPYNIYADSSGGNPTVNNFAHIYTTSIISDTLNWTTISGAFIADSAYNYVIIGNFFEDINTDTLILDSNNICYSYYYLDDICVSTDSLTCSLINELDDIESNKIITIYPNPLNSSMVLKLNESFQHDVFSVKLYDSVWGREIKNYEGKNNELRIEKDDLKEGLYFLKIQLDNLLITKKIIITN